MASLAEEPAQLRVFFHRLAGVFLEVLPAVTSRGALPLLIGGFGRDGGAGFLMEQFLFWSIVWHFGYPGLGVETSTFWRPSRGSQRRARTDE